MNNCRLLVEFRTRKAHRWVVREKDLLKYWAVMITCVSVYLASGTISTLENSAHGEHSIWNWSVQPAGSAPSIRAAVTSPGHPTPTTRSHLLFPKSIKGEGVYYSTAPPTPGATRATPAPVLPGTSASYNGTSPFLFQKGRVSRREIISEMNDTLTVAADKLVSNKAAAEDNEKNNSCHHNQPPDGQSVLSVRFGHQGSRLVAPFYVCRQLWWHYVNMAGRRPLSVHHNDSS